MSFEPTPMSDHAASPTRAQDGEAAQHRRPELRLLTTPLTTSSRTSSPAETPPQSAFTATTIDTPYSITPPFSALTGGQVILPEAPSTVPRIRAQSLQTSRSAIYPPPALPQLLPNPVGRLPSASPTASSSSSIATSASLDGSVARRSGTRLAKSSSLPVPLSPGGNAPASSRLSHPYARIYAKRAAEPQVKRRKMWNHALEKTLFTPEEIASLGAPNRRAIYTASLEAHVEELHAQLLELGMYPVQVQALDQYRGLNSKTARSMVSGLHKDACDLKTQLMELERATQALHRAYDQKASASASAASAADAASHGRRHSVSAASYVYPNLFVGPSGSNVSGHTTMS